MPTLLVIGDLRFFFFSNEGTEPPHVHVEAGEAHAKFWLDPLELAVAHRMKQQDLSRARLIVAEHQTEFLERWHEHFGA